MNLNIRSLQYTALKSCIKYQQMHALPSATLFLLLKKIWEDNEQDFLRSLYCDFKVFTVLLDEKYRTTLLQSFSSVNIRSGTPSVADILLKSYKESNAIKNDIELGLKFAQFFEELGKFWPAFNFLTVVKDTCNATNNQEMLLECYGQFIYALSFQYRFKHALKLYELVKNLVNKVRPLPNCANVFSNISFMHFMLGDYYQARVCANLAIKQLNNQLPTKVIIKVLRLSAKVFTINRDYRQARLLIQHALILCKYCRPSDPYIFAEVFMDYAYYLSQIKYYLSSIAAYCTAMKTYKKLYNGKPNLYQVLVERDLVFTLLKLMEKRTPLNTLRHFYQMICIHIYHAAQDLIKLGHENHTMHQNAICEARALNLELYALYLTDISTDRHDCLTIAKEIHETSLRNHRLLFDEPKNQASIKIVDCLVSIGRVCQYLNEFSSAERAFKEAETITKKLKCRSNAEYFSVQIHRAELYRSNPQFFTRKCSILQAITAMKRCTRLLIKFEDWNCEILDKFYHELIELYKMNKNVNKVIRYENLLLEWRTESSLQRFRALTDYLPQTEPITTIINKIRNMNIEVQNRKFAYAIQINKNETSAI